MSITKWEPTMSYAQEISSRKFDLKNSLLKIKLLGRTVNTVKQNSMKCLHNQNGKGRRGLAFDLRSFRSQILNVAWVIEEPKYLWII